MPDIVSGQPTNWIVITGAPTAGKTTVLNALGELGYNVVPESLRIYVRALLEKGAAVPELRSDPLQFQTGLVAAKLRVEWDLHPQKLTFLDRALPDSMAYYEMYGLDPKLIAHHCKQFRYRSVLVFDPLPVDGSDGIRVEDAERAAFLDRRLEEIYRDLGYSPVRIPVMSIEERVNMLINWARELS